MSTGHKQHAVTAASASVQEQLSEHFSGVEAYQYNPAAIRVRIIDERFRNLPKLKRLDLVEPFLEAFSEEIQQQLIFILALAPGEETHADFSWLNREFEEPEKST